MPDELAYILFPDLASPTIAIELLELLGIFGHGPEILGGLLSNADVSEGIVGSANALPQLVEERTRFKIEHKTLTTNGDKHHVVREDRAAAIINSVIQLVLELAQTGVAEIGISVVDSGLSKRLAKESQNSNGKRLREILVNFQRHAWSMPQGSPRTKEHIFVKGLRKRSPPPKKYPDVPTKTDTW